MVWRREFGVEEMAPEKVSPEAETGKEIVFGYDRDSRPVLYMVSCRLTRCVPSVADTECSTASLPTEHRDRSAIPASSALLELTHSLTGPRQIDFVVWCLEVSFSVGMISYGR